jgi:hypothetical protein
VARFVLDRAEHAAGRFKLNSFGRIGSGLLSLMAAAKVAAGGGAPAENLAAPGSLP